MHNDSMRMTEGPIAGQMLRFAAPLFLGNLFQQLYNTADALIVGRMLGYDALAAVSATGTLVFLIISLFVGISAGSGVLISRYFGAQDYAGGGHFSGRMTAPLCVAGGICLQLLEKEGIRVIARIAEIGGISDVGELEADISKKDFPVVNDTSGKAMIDRIMEIKAQKDSLGGVVECKVPGLPAGLGGPLFEGLESRIAALVFAIPAVKGVEFGAGFGAARLRGSENNDPFLLREGEIVTETNRCGGLLGGISDGMPLCFRAAFKPTPSIALPQRSVDLERMEETELRIAGRHDPCVVPRAVPVVEAAAALAVYDALLTRRKELAQWN